MNFRFVPTFVDDSIIVEIAAHYPSHVIWISNHGLERSNTGRPQPTVDYDPADPRYHRVRIIGVDQI